jgi:hypothetical protein
LWSSFLDAAGRVLDPVGGLADLRAGHSASSATLRHASRKSSRSRTSAEASLMSFFNSPRPALVKHTHIGTADLALLGQHDKKVVVWRIS